MKKRMLCIVLLVAVCLGIGLYAYLEGAMSSAKMADDFSSYDDLIEHSPIVITATVTSHNKEFTYKEITFALTEVEVIDFVRGKTGKNTLQILQTRSKEDPYLKKGTQVLLFLSEYDGPIAQDAYVINGLYHGQYVIKDGILRTVNKSAALPNKTDLESVVADVKNTAYIEETHQQLTPEEIERINEQERKLEEALKKELEARKNSQEKD